MNYRMLSDGGGFVDKKKFATLKLADSGPVELSCRDSQNPNSCKRDTKNAKPPKAEKNYVEENKLRVKVPKLTNWERTMMCGKSMADD